MKYILVICLGLALSGCTTGDAVTTVKDSMTTTGKTMSTSIDGTTNLSKSSENSSWEYDKGEVK